jgi:site-specific recombinase XerD
MPALIDQYRMELEKINVFAASTVEIYTASIIAFCEFARNILLINPIRAKGADLLRWVHHLKDSGIGQSRLGHHHYALKSFFAFLQKTGEIKTNPAQPLVLLFKRQRERTLPVCAADVQTLLDSFDQSTWRGLRNRTMVSLLWALGLRSRELTGLRVRDLETGHGRRIGLLRIQGKNKKERALFVVDRLFDTLTSYLAHPDTPSKSYAPMFPGEHLKAISIDRLQRIVKDQSRTVGIEPPVTPRMLRHSFATEMYHQGVPLHAIQVMMGHDSIADTSVYVHVSDQVVKHVLDAVSVSRRWP